MVNADLDAGWLQRALRKAICAINNLDWTGRQIADRVSYTPGCLGRQLDAALDPLAALGSEHS